MEKSKKSNVSFSILIQWTFVCRFATWSSKKTRAVSSGKQAHEQVHTDFIYEEK